MQGSNASSTQISPELVNLIRQICPLELPERLQQARGSAAGRLAGHGATTADADAAPAVQRIAQSRHITSSAVKVTQTLHLQSILLSGCHH